jgi:hypothetical protein
VTEKKLKVGLRAGGGPEPGYKWSVLFLTVAEAEARRILKRSDQYDHVIDQIRDLATQEDPSRPSTLRVERVGDFYELKEKGGPLGKTNLRVFFIIEEERKSIVLLGHYKKEEEGKTPSPVVRTMSRRRRKYLNGDYGDVL